MLQKMYAEKVRNALTPALQTVILMALFRLVLRHHMYHKFPSEFATRCWELLPQAQHVPNDSAWFYAFPGVQCSRGP